MYDTDHVGRGIIASNGVLAHEEPENENVSAVGDAEAIISVEIGEDKHSSGSFRSNQRNENHEHQNPWIQTRVA